MSYQGLITNQCNRQYLNLLCFFTYKLDYTIDVGSFFSCSLMPTKTAVVVAYWTLLHPFNMTTLYKSFFYNYCPLRKLHYISFVVKTCNKCLHYIKKKLCRNLFPCDKLSFAISWNLPFVSLRYWGHYPIIMSFGWSASTLKIKEIKNWWVWEKVMNMGRAERGWHICRHINT